MSKPIVSDNPAVRVESPPWDMTDECWALSPVDHKPPASAGGEGDGSPPPLSQMRAIGPVAIVPGVGGADTQSMEPIGGKSTPSTISESPSERDETALGGDTSRGEVAMEGSKRDDRQAGKARKRTSARGGDLDDLEVSEEGQDTKRRPRKSARLA